MTRPPLSTRIKEEYSTITFPTGFLILLIGIFDVLFGLQFLICNRIIPWDIAIHHFVLNIWSPDLSNVFLSHYVHDPFSFDHLLVNALLFALAMCCIYLVGYLILPALRWKPPVHLVRNTFLCIFLLLPFLLSGIAIAIGRHTSTLYVCGSSGIVAAVMGFAIFLVATALAMICRERREEERGCTGLYAIGLVALLLPLVFWALLGDRDILSLILHFVSYFFGLAVPLIFLRRSGTVEG